MSSTLSDATVILTDNFNSQPAGYSAWTPTGANLSYTLVTTGNYKLTAVNSGSVSSASISKRVSLIPGLTYKVNFLLDATTIGTGSPKILFEYYDNDNSNSDYRAFVRSTNGASPASPDYTFYITPLTADGTFTIKWENTATSTFNFAVDDFIITQYENKSIPLYSSVINSMTDYTAFGAPLGGRNFSSLNYRYGFNGKENDNEVKGVAGGQQDYGMRIYDPRLGKFLSVDPLTQEYPELTPYQFASNRPIDGVDLDGLEYHQNARPGEEIKGILTPAKDNTAITLTEKQVMAAMTAATYVKPPEDNRPVVKEKYDPAQANFDYNFRLYGPAVIPFYTVGTKTLAGEEITGKDWTQDAIGIVPLTRVGKLVGPLARNVLKLSDNAFYSAAGLIFKSGSVDGNRLSHVLAHTIDNLKKPLHGVFDVGEDLIGTLDEAWNIAKKGGDNVVKTVQENGNVSYIIDMGRKVGYEGGKRGSGEALNKINLIINQSEEGAEVITAFPIK